MNRRDMLQTALGATALTLLEPKRLLVVSDMPLDLEQRVIDVRGARDRMFHNCVFHGPVTILGDGVTIQYSQIHHDGSGPALRIANDRPASLDGLRFGDLNALNA